MSTQATNADGFEICPIHNVVCDTPEYNTEAYGDMVIYVPIGYACHVCAAERDEQDRQAESFDFSEVYE